MRSRISTNAATVLRRMLARRQAVTRELSAAARGLALEIGAESKRQLQTGIYNVQIPKNPKSRQPRWTRTGNLKRREHAFSVGPNIVLENLANYALDRYLRGTEGGRPIHTPGVQSVQWQAEAIKKLLARIRERRRQAVLKALRSP